MSGTTTNSYDALLYESQFNPASHEDRIASMALLFGLDAPPVDHGRVPELGGGGGGNIIARAQSPPEAEFVGIDLSPRQVADGQAVVREAGLSNVPLKAM